MNSVLIRLPNWIGDFIMSLGLVRCLREKFPDTHIAAYSRKTIATLASLEPMFDEVITINDRGLRGKFHTMRKLRSMKYDLHIVLPPSFSSALIAGGIAAPSLGFRGQNRSFLLSESVKRPADLHRAMEYIALVNKMLDIPLPYTDSIVFCPNRVPDISHFELPDDYIVFNPFAVAESRRLTPAKAARIIEKLGSDRTVLIGTPFQKALCDQIGTGINLSGMTSLPELVGILKSAKTVLTVDSGPAHLANALERPVVDISGPDDPAGTRPYNSQFLHLIRRDLNCSPCVKNRCRYGTNAWIEDIQASELIEAVLSNISE